jgi:DNA invertase Pin-like site-specific DNA recombinase
MSSRQGASWGTSAVDKAGSQAGLPRVAIAHRKQREHPTGGAFLDPLSLGAGSSEPREPTSARDRRVPALEPALSSVNDRSRGASAQHARPENARTISSVLLLGYASTDAQQRDCVRADLQRQAEEIASECERRGLRLLEVVREKKRQHRRPLERPGLGYALRRIAAAEASGLVVSDLYRVSHSLADLGRVLEWLERRDARFVAARPGLDTDEEAGRLVVQTIIEVSRWERQRLAERTRSGMQAARRKGPGGVADSPELTERIAGMRAQGMTLQAIADELNADGVPTVRGGAKWRPSSVQSAVGYQRPPAGKALDRRFGEATGPSPEDDNA